MFTFKAKLSATSLLCGVRCWFGRLVAGRQFCSVAAVELVLLVVFPFGCLLVVPLLGFAAAAAAVVVVRCQVKMLSGR